MLRTLPKHESYLLNKTYFNGIKKLLVIIQMVGL